MEVRDAKLIFSTGKEVYCCLGVVGLALYSDWDNGRVKNGFDGSIDTVVDPGHDPECGKEALTKEECAELARHMIKEWEKFLTSLKV
jgi:hypothetical protein